MSKKSSGPLLKIFGWLGVAFIVLALIFWFSVDQSRRALETTRAELEARGEFFDAVLLAPPDPPTENNGGPALVAAAENLKAFKDKEIDKTKFGQIETTPGFATIAHQRPTVQVGKQEVTWEEFAGNMEPVRPFLGTIRQAAQAPVLDIKPNYAQGFAMVLDYVSHVMTASQFLSRESLLFLQQGKPTETVNNIESQLAIVRMLVRQPILLNDLVAVILISNSQTSTWELLQATPTKENLKRLQDAWESTRIKPSLAGTLRVERAVGLTAFHASPGELRSVTGLGGPSGGKPGTGSLEEAVNTIGFASWQITYGTADQIHFLKDYQILIDSLQTGDDWTTFFDQTKSIEEKLLSSHRKRLISQLAMPAIFGTFQRIAHADVLRTLTITAIAIKRYQLDHNGHPPDQLGDLIPAYLETAPIDPIDHQPLRYRRDGDGFVLYSVGTNGSDEGGDSTAPAGERRRDFTDGLDIVWPRPATSENSTDTP